MNEDGSIKSQITKFLSEEENKGILDRAKVENGDIVFIVADKNKVVYDSLGNLRLHIAKKAEIKMDEGFNFLWVTNFPMFEYDENEKRYKAMHHPLLLWMKIWINWKPNPEKSEQKPTTSL